MKKVYWIGIAAGLIPSLFNILLFFVGYGEVYSKNYTKFNLVELVVILLVVPLAVYIERRENLPDDLKGDNLFTFNNALKTGIGTSAFAAIIVCFFTYVYFQFINTDLLNDTISEILKAAKENNWSEENKQKSVEAAKMFYAPFFQSTSALFGILIAGFLVSVISAVILKREN